MNNVRGLRFACWVTLFAFGCSTTTVMRIPLASNPESEKANQCLADCQKYRNVSNDKYLDCFELCPGVSMKEGDKCGASEHPPLVACEERSEFSGTKSLAVVGGVFLGLLIIGVMAGSGSSSHRAQPEAPADPRD